MLWAVTATTFLVTVIVLLALVYAFSPGAAGIAGRLSRLLNSTAPAREEGFSEKQKERAFDALARVGKLLPASQGKAQSRGELMITRAGIRDQNAVLAIRGVKVLLPIALVTIVYLTEVYRYSPFLIFAAAVIAGVLLPEMWLLWRIRGRQHRLQKALPDGLDLLVICVEVGLGLDQAILRVAEELQIVHPELSDELQLVNLEMRVGKTRIDALRELARRTGLEDIKSLVAMLIQTERFGTSIAQSLRVHSDELRTKRRQRAEEMAAKTTVKMVPPLVFFIFPALMVVILGPAIITIYREFLK
jgi:tight adherence protein C